MSSGRATATPSSFLRTWSPEVAKALLGSAVMALGICLFVAVELGSDSIDVLLDGMSRTLGITLGQAQLIFTVATTIVAFIVNRSRVGVLSVVGGIMTSQLIDLFNIWILPMDLAAQGLALRVAALLAGQVCLSASYAMLQAVRNGMNVTDAIAQKLGSVLPGGYAVWRTVIDAACLVGGMLIGGVFGVGTVLFVLVNGSLVKFFARLLARVGFGAHTEAERA